jgi:hypothetical protein
MLVRCVSNSGADLPEISRDSRMGIDASTEFALTVGRDYVVFAVTNYLATIWYYVMDDDDLPYPVWKPAPLIEMVDGRVPDHWVLAQYRNRSDGGHRFLLSFPEWAENWHYYELLVGGNSAALAQFELEKARHES